MLYAQAGSIEQNQQRSALSAKALPRLRRGSICHENPGKYFPAGDRAALEKTYGTVIKSAFSPFTNGWRKLRAGVIRLRLQLKSPAGRSPRYVLHKVRARDRNAAANLANLYQLRGFVPVGL
jgi:hypothetical protein